MLLTVLGIFRPFLIRAGELTAITANQKSTLQMSQLTCQFFRLTLISDPFNSPSPKLQLTREGDVVSQQPRNSSVPDELILPALLWSAAPFQVRLIICTFTQTWTCVDSHYAGLLQLLSFLALF